MWMMKDDLPVIKRFTFFTLFSGLGGAALGLLRAGGKDLLAIDINDIACKMLKLNFPGIAVLEGDIKNLTKKNTARFIGDGVDIIQASPPCQGASQSNTTKKRNINNELNLLFYQAIRVVAEWQPKIAIFETVPGLLMGEIQKHYVNILYELDRAGYNITTWQLLASNYAAPQARMRVWIIATRKNLGFSSPISIPDTIPGFISVHDVCPEILGFTNGQSIRYTMPSNNPYFTMTRSQLSEIIDDLYNKRELNPDELLTLSTFPSDYNFGNLKSKEIHQLLGNCVLPLQAQVIANYLYDTILAP
jgi:DNA (cytosine-5)-methyltransferase 1